MNGTTTGYLAFPFVSDGFLAYLDTLLYLDLSDTRQNENPSSAM